MESTRRALHARRSSLPCSPGTYRIGASVNLRIRRRGMRQLRPTSLERSEPPPTRRLMLGRLQDAIASVEGRRHHGRGQRAATAAPTTPATTFLGQIKAARMGDPEANSYLSNPCSARQTQLVQAIVAEHLRRPAGRRQSATRNPFREPDQRPAPGSSRQTVDVPYERDRPAAQRSSRAPTVPTRTSATSGLRASQRSTLGHDRADRGRRQPASAPDERRGRDRRPAPTRRIVRHDEATLRSSTARARPAGRHPHRRSWRPATSRRTSTR